MTIQQLFNYAQENDMLDYEIAIHAAELATPLHGDYCDFMGLAQVIDQEHNKYFYSQIEPPKNVIWLMSGDGVLYGQD